MIFLSSLLHRLIHGMLRTWLFITEWITGDHHPLSMYTLLHFCNSKIYRIKNLLTLLDSRSHNWTTIEGNKGALIIFGYQGAENSRILVHWNVTPISAPPEVCSLKPLPLLNTNRWYKYHRFTSATLQPLICTDKQFVDHEHKFYLVTVSTSLCCPPTGLHNFPFFWLICLILLSTNPVESYHSNPYYM